MTSRTSRQDPETPLIESTPRLLRDILESLSDGILVLDENLRYRYFNKAMSRIARLSHEEMLRDDRYIWEIFPHLVEQGVDKMMRDALAGKTCTREEIPFTLTNGHSGYTNEIYMPLRGEDNEIQGVIGVVYDITARVEAEKKRRELEAQMLHGQKLESLGLLAGGIAHDFNNLLQALVGHTELAKDYLAGESAAQNHLDQVLRSASRASELCKQLLAYSGRGTSKRSTTSLSDLIQEMASLLQVSLAGGVGIHLELEGDMPSITADLSQVRQVLMNLVANASDSLTGKGGLVTIRTGTETCSKETLAAAFAAEQTEPGEYAFVEVADSGCGMDDATRERIFDPFFSSKGTGRGLGLAACVGIIHAHSGAIRVRSEAGTGTQVRVWLPAGSKPNEGPELETSAADGAAIELTGKLLLVDDEAEILASTKKVLTSHGFETATAKSGEEAMEMLQDRGSGYSAVLLDLTMPGISGLETLARIRELDERVPVLLCSGYHEQDVSEAIKDDPLTGFIQKPYRARQLLAALSRLTGF